MVPSIDEAAVLSSIQPNRSSDTSQEEKAGSSDAATGATFSEPVPGPELQSGTTVKASRSVMIGHLSAPPVEFLDGDEANQKTGLQRKRWQLGLSLLLQALLRKHSNLLIHPSSCLPLPSHFTFNTLNLN